MPLKAAKVKGAAPFPSARISSFATQQKTVKNGNPQPLSAPSKTRTKAVSNNKNHRTATSDQIKTVTLEKKEKATYDKELEIKFDKMIEGDLSDLPPLPRSVVRIFLSSTFSDTKVERNVLSRKVYPNLRDYCADLGLDFQIVDLRWGVVDDAQNDHSATKICLQEIENCQRVSLGPNFIGFVSHRYGGRPLATELQIEQFETIKAEVKTLGLKHGELLDKWFWKDDNNQPPLYILQPVRRHLPYFGDLTEGNEDLQKQDAKTWSTTHKQLNCLLRTAADSLFKKKKITAEEKHFYSKSVTEWEIENGILKNKEANKQTLFYHRKLIGLEKDLDDDLIQKYIECNTDNNMVVVNDEVQRLLDSLVHDKVCKNLANTNIKSYTVPWKKGGIDPDKNKEHDKYLTNFCDAFTSDVLEMISKAKHENETKIRQREYYSRYNEILHHLKFCVTKCETFCGQGDILKKAKTYILDEKNRQPLVIYANSGAGKTSLMAMINKSLNQWVKGEYIGVIRFLGTSPDTINIYDVLFSICGQIADTEEVIMEPVAYKNIASLIAYVPRFLRRMSSLVKKPIIILLDSIDQLADSHNVFLMSWLPLHLPPNIKIILSTLPQEHNILKNLIKLFPDSSNFVEVPILPPETGKEIIEKYLSKKKRKISKKQMDLLLSKFQMSPTPLYLKLQLDDALKWASYTDESSINTSTTVREAINLLFDDLEKRFGHELVKCALGFITVGFNGLSEIELEDALSCNNDVLDEIYRYHDPPVQNMIRIPPVLWARIRFEIQEYLVERLSQGKTTVFWYHRQFIEAAAHRYVSNDDMYLHHKILFELFSSEEGVYKDIYLSRRKLLMKSADRQVTPQPLNSKNVRKLECMLHHVHHGLQFISLDTAKQSVFCNLLFIHACINAFSVARLVKDFTTFLVKYPDEEIEFVKDLLVGTKTNLKNLQVLAGTLLAYINPQKHQKSLQNLLEKCRSVLQKYDKAVLIPTFPCLASRASTGQQNSVTLTGRSEIMDKGMNLVVLKTLTKDDFEQLMLYNNTESSTIDLEVPLSKDALAILSSSEQRLAVYSNDEITLINLTNLKRKSIPLKSLKVRKLFFNTDSSLIGYLSLDNQVNILKVKDLTKHATFTINDGQISNIFCTEVPDVRAAVVGKMQSGHDGYAMIKQLDSKTAGERVKFKSNGSPVFSSILDEFLVIAVETNVNIYKHETLELSSQLEIKAKGDINYMLVSEMKLMAAVFCGQSHIVIIDVLQGTKLCEIFHNGTILTQDLSSDGEMLIVGGNSGEVALYSVATGLLKSDLAMGRGPLKYVGLLEDCIALADLEDRVSFLSFSHIKSQNTNKTNVEVTDDLLNQTNIVSMALANCGQVVLTSHEDGWLKLWNLSDASFLGTYDKSARFDQMLLDNTDVVLALDQSQKALQVFTLGTGEDQFKGDIPDNVIAMAMNEARTKAFLVGRDEKSTIHIIDLKILKVVYSLDIKKMHDFVSLKIFVSASERYLVLLAEVTKKDLEAIKIMWKKGANHAPQPHPYRLSAIDITTSSGAMLHCYRRLTKIPSLCENACAYQGNTVIFAARRHAIYWDLPTGKCDQQMSKGTKHVMIYRPEWTGDGKCKGHNTCFQHAPNKKYTVVGSHDGYVINYNFDSGLPLEMKAPPTNHSTEVSHVGISPDSKWVTSACLNGVIKLWSPVTGLEIFSLNVKNKIHQLFISANSKYLVLKTAGDQSRILIFKLHSL
ncbi:NACHT and WD repeat domain-containing protein 2 [Patella vulgata]|uniref:NACHT and WD repeat domain-containing protein 2 n=1 Tax=Patella vulgata TaxID=6465 RepID=UPI00218060CC|nr:NACHT and WD repeat domain-containing protein 2 [Patella vulgata]